MNILLTGSGGFIGKNIQYRLKNKFNLYAPRSFELNLCDTNAVKNYFAKNNIDFIIHCGTVGGARGVEDEENTVEVNLSMVENLLNSKNKNAKIILFGSGAMYGKNRDLHKVKEVDIGKFIPNDLYGKSKMMIAQKIKDRKDVLCLNIFGCYGYGEKENRFPSYAINQNLEHKPIEINQNVVFDYLFIEDLMHIVEYFISNKWHNNVINVTPTKSASLIEIAELINEISDYKSEIIVKNSILNYEYTGDNTILLKNMPFLQFTPMKHSLLKFYEYKKKLFLEAK